MTMKYWIGVLVLLACAGNCVAEDQRFTVRDSIEMTRFSDPSGRDKNAAPQASPDGHYFLVVTSRGLIRSNEVESKIWLFDNRAIGRFLRNGGEGGPPAPKLLVRMAAVPVISAYNSYQSIISDLRWTPDSRTIYFLSQNSAGRRHLFSIDRTSTRLQSLSQSGVDVERYSFIRGVIVYSAMRASRSHTKFEQSESSPSNPDITDITGMPIAKILFPDERGWPLVHELWVVQNGHMHRVHSSPAQLSQREFEQSADRDVLSISPDQHYAIQIKPVASIPSSWEAYIPRAGFETWRIKHDDVQATSPFNFFRARQYVLIDLNSGKVTPLIDAPFGSSLAYPEPAQAVWSQDGTRVLLTNTFLPLANTDAAGHLERESLCTAAVVALASREVHCVVSSRVADAATTQNPTPMRLQTASFGATENEVILRFDRRLDKKVQLERYRYLNGKWNLLSSDESALEEKPEGKPSSDGNSVINVRIKQSLNEPPALWANDVVTGKAAEIWNPNPQLRTLKFGLAATYHWRDKTGFEWTGGLIKPVDYVVGHRYPLVIQTHGFQDSEFITDGQYTTAMAARPLASDGIIVLQIATSYAHTGQLQELADNMLGYESAVEQLAGDGLIDPKHVGIIGFSRTCWYVEATLINDPHLFAAASITDGIDHGYMQSMFFDLNRTTSEAQNIYAAKPFGTGIEKWTKLAANFHLDRVQTPLMITAILPGAVLEEWEIYSSLYQQKKPVDFVYIPDGQHILQKPMERLGSQQGNVDWFRFWLQGYKDPDPAKKAQYERWEHLKELQNADNKFGEQSSISVTKPN